MKQQTAIDWLIQIIQEKNGLSFTDYFSEFIEEAKEKEKQQIIEAWDLGRRDIDYPASGEKYYDHIYNTTT